MCGTAYKALKDIVKKSLKVKSQPDGCGFTFIREKLEEKMKMKMIRNLRTTERGGNTRLAFEPLLLEQSGFKIGDNISLTIERDQIVIMRDEAGDGVITRRKRANWSEPRPYFDRCSSAITSVLRAKERIDILVYSGKLIIRQQKTFELLSVDRETFNGNQLRKLRLFSLPCGGGIASANLVETGMYENVGGLDFWGTAIEAYMHNFSNGMTLFSDVKHIHPDYIPQADVCFLSAECDEYSPLGTKKFGVTSGLSPHFARLIWAMQSSAVIIEQVPNYFTSRAYRQLQTLLRYDGFTSWYEAVIDSYDYGAVARRKRGYAVAFKNTQDFQWPTAPNIPKRFRHTIGQVIGAGWEQEGEWKSIEGSAMEAILNKTSSQNNFNAAHNKTLVSLDSNQMSTIIQAYRRTQVTSSYLKHPDEEKWRFFTPRELCKLLNVPDWYEFPLHHSLNQQTELLGQSVEGTVIRGIGIEVGVSLMGNLVKNRSTYESSYGILENRKGQLELMI